MSQKLTSYFWCHIVTLDSHRFTFFLHKDSQALTKCCFRWQVCVTRRLCPAPRDSWMCSMTQRSFSSLWKIWINSQNACGLSLQSHCTNTAKIWRSSRERKRAKNVTALNMQQQLFPVSCCVYMFFFNSYNKNTVFSLFLNRSLVFLRLKGCVFFCTTGKYGSPFLPQD